MARVCADSALSPCQRSLPADSNLDPQDTFNAEQDVYAFVTSNLADGQLVFLTALRR